METKSEPAAPSEGPQPQENESNNAKPSAPPVAKYKYITYGGNHPEVIIEALNRRGNFERVSHKEDTFFDTLSLIWRPVQYSNKRLIEIDSINCARKYVCPLILNHIEALKNITSKTGLIRSLRNYYLSTELAVDAKYTVFDSMATSYILEADNEGEEYNSFVQRYKELSQGLYMKEHLPAKHCEQNLWLLKPANMNQGKGIKMIRNLRELKANLSSKSPHSLWVLQKYIEKPLLYDERKFDIRVWVLVTDYGDVFLYKDGYIRTSSEKYSLESTANYVHLTNNCLQVYGENYSKHEPGNTLSFDAFNTYLAKAYEGCKNTKVDFETHIVPRMKDLIIDTIMSVKAGIIAPSKKRGSTFELLGYDFMIDEDLRVWLIEVNTNPYLGIPNSYIKVILPNMLDSMFDLVLNHVYPSNTKKEQCENRFELLYCEKHSRFSQVAVNQRRSFARNLLYPIKELEQVSGKRYPSPKPRQIHTRLKSELNLSAVHSVKRSCDISRIRQGTLKGTNTEYVGEALEQKIEILQPATPDALPRILENVSKPRATPNYRKRMHKAGLEEMAQELVKGQNYVGLVLLFEKMLSVLKSILKKSVVTVKAAETTEQDLTKAINTIGRSKMVYAFVADNQGKFTELQESALNQSNGLSNNLRLSIISILEQMAEDSILRKYLTTTNSLHLLLDAVLSGVCETPKAALQVLTKLLKSGKTGVYIPGQTLDAEKQRIRVMQHGFLPVLLHVLLNTKDEYLKSTIEEYLKHNCYLKELEWNIKILHRYLAGQSNYFNKHKNEEGTNLPEIPKKLQQEDLGATAPNCQIPFMIYTHANFDHISSKRTQKAELLQKEFTTSQRFTMTHHLDMWQGKDYLLSDKCRLIDLQAVKEKLLEMVKERKAILFQQELEKAKKQPKLKGEHKKKVVRELKRELDAHIILKQVGCQNNNKASVAEVAKFAKTTKARRLNLQKNEKSPTPYATKRIASRTVRAESILGTSLLKELEKLRKDNEKYDVEEEKDTVPMVCSSTPHYVTNHDTKPESKEENRVHTAGNSTNQSPTNECSKSVGKRKTVRRWWNISKRDYIRVYSVENLKERTKNMIKDVDPQNAVNLAKR